MTGEEKSRVSHPRPEVAGYLVFRVRARDGRNANSN